MPAAAARGPVADDAHNAAAEVGVVAGDAHRGDEDGVQHRPSVPPLPLSALAVAVYTLTAAYLERHGFTRDSVVTTMFGREGEPGSLYPMGTAL